MTSTELIINMNLDRREGMHPLKNWNTLFADLTDETLKRKLRLAKTGAYSMIQYNRC